MPYFGFLTKNTLFGPFIWKDLSKNSCHIWNQHPQIYLFGKLNENRKMPQFGNWKAWFGRFWSGNWKQHYHIWNQHPRIFLIAKFGGKTKMPIRGTRNVLFRHFWGLFLKNFIVVIEISTLKLVYLQNLQKK